MARKNDEIKVTKVEFLYVNQPSRRKIKVKLNTGSTIYIERCYESWEQYGGTTDELYITMPIAERYNDWLHGMEELDVDGEY